MVLCQPLEVEHEDTRGPALSGGLVRWRGVGTMLRCAQCPNVETASRPARSFKRYHRLYLGWVEVCGGFTTTPTPYNSPHPGL